MQTLSNQMEEVLRHVCTRIKKNMLCVVFSIWHVKIKDAFSGYCFVRLENHSTNSRTT